MLRAGGGAFRHYDAMSAITGRYAAHQRGQRAVVTASDAARHGDAKHQQNTSLAAPSSMRATARQCVGLDEKAGSFASLLVYLSLKNIEFKMLRSPRLMTCASHFPPDDEVES